MEKIMTREEKEKKVRKNQLFIGGILILIMIFSTVGYALNDKGDETTIDKTTYNGIDFIRDTSGYWNSVIQGQQFITRYNPEEVSKINFLSTLRLVSYSNKPLYFVGNIGEGSSEISRNLADRIVLRIQQACLNEKDCIGNFPIKSCSIDNLIVFNEISNNETESMYQKENCVFISSVYENQTQYTDKLLFSLLGI